MKKTIYRITHQLKKENKPTKMKDSLNVEEMPHRDDHAFKGGSIFASV